MQVLLTNPEVDELTYYLSAWTNQMLKNCKQKHKFYHLKRHKVTRNHFDKILSKRSIDLVLLCGHGEKNKVYGDNDIILDQNNSQLLNGKIIHALSCQSAKSLGKISVNNGATAYLGYQEDFIMFMDNQNNLSAPLKDSTAALFLDAAFTAPKNLLNGKSPEETLVITKNEYNKNIRKALASDIQSDNDQFINWLYWDRDNLILCE